MDGYAINGDVGSQAVLEVGTISFEGNIIPPTWFDHIKYPNGKPHLNAIVVLSEIVYWYRPMTVKDPVSLKVKEYRKKFKGEYLQLNRKELSEKFGITPKQATDALKKLEECEVIKKHLLKSLMTDSGKKLGNVPYVELVPSTLRNITHPYYLQDRGSVPQEGGLVPVGQTNTENTYTENTYRKTAAYTDPTPNNPPLAPSKTAAASQEFLAIQARLTEISSTLPDPFTGIDDLANTLLRNGKTAADVDTLWNAMQYKNSPAGAFIHAVKTNLTPKTKPVPKPQDDRPKDGDTKMVNGVKKIYKNTRWYDFHRVSGGDG